MHLSWNQIDPLKSPIIWGVAVAALFGMIASLFLGNLSRQIAVQLAQITAALLLGFFIGKWWLKKKGNPDPDSLAFEENDQLRLWSELSQTGRWYYDLQRQCFYGNQTIQKIYGFKPLKPPGATATLEEAMEHVHPDDRELIFKGIEKAMEGKSQIIDYRVIVDGKTRYLHTNRMPRYDESGKVIGIYGCSQDVTELVEAKLAAKKSEHQMRKLLENAPFFIGTLQPDLTVTHYSKWFETTLGYTKEDIASITTFEITHSDDLKKTEQFYGEILSGRSDNIRYEKHYLAKDGSILTVDASLIAIRDQNRKLESILLIAFDITDRKKIEEELRKSEERLRIAATSANIGMWDYNLQTHDVFWTPESFTLIGYPAEEAGVHPDYEFFEKLHPNDLIKLKEAVRQNAEGETDIYRCEFRIRCADGHWAWNEGVGRVIEWTEDGKPLRMAGVQIDISEQKQLEFELIKAREEAEKANVAKSAFLANMSHEIRTPMTAILGFTELLESADLDKEESKEFLKTIQRNGQHLLQLINDILDLSKIDSGWFTIKPEPCHYLTVVRETIEIMRVRAAKKKIKLYLEAEGKLPDQIETDPDRLRQCLINLIGNAIKFTEEGEIRLRLKYLPSWHFDQPAIQFEVIDSGIGIPEHKLDLLFNPFVQADDSMARRHGGTGLGLAITKQITEMLGGQVEVKSKIGQGSTFTITLPIGKIPDLPMIEIPNRTEVTAGTLGIPSEISKTIAAPEIASDTEPIEPTLETKRILLAEDGPDNQRFLCTTLRKAGAAVEVAPNGLVAVEMVRANPDHYDLILMDMQMPEMDGYEATSVLREIQVKTPIIALTAHAFAEEGQKCLDVGCSGFCTKPINPKELINMVLKHLAQVTTN